MKFIQDRDGDWSAHEIPFKFVLFPQADGAIATVWAYHDRTGEEMVSDLQGAIDWCHQFMLTTTLDQLRRIAPTGSRTAETDTGWTFVCDGYDRDMGYQCVLKPGHSGQCYYPIKSVWFTKE
jgi:hypothetical protein